MGKKIIETLRSDAKAVLAGVMISCGCILSASTQNKVAGALLFSTGLIAIIALNLELYTGKAGYATLKKLPRLTCILLLNALGCLLMAIMVMFTPSYQGIKEVLTEIQRSKAQIGMIALFVKAIMCGGFMFCAVEGYRRTSSFLLPVLCVAAFILCGFEHSVADSFYFWFTDNGGFPNFGKLLIIALGNLLGAQVVAKATR